MESILDIASVAFQGDTVRRLSSVLHETQNATERGLKSAVPASLAGLAAHASSERNAEELLGTIRGGSYPHIAPHEMGATIDDPKATARMAQSGQGFIGSLLGTKFSRVVDAIAGQAGLSRSSASTLLGLATPLVMQAVGKATTTGKLDARGLSRFLADQGKQATSSLPNSLTSALGVPDSVRSAGGARFTEARGNVEHALDGARMRAQTAIHSAEHRADELRGPSHQWKGLAWLLAGFAALALLGLALFRPKTPEPVQGLNVPTPTMPETRPLTPTIPELRTPPTPEMPAAPQQATEPAAPMNQAVGAADTMSPTTGAGALDAFLAGTGATPHRFVLRGISFPTASAQTIASSALLSETAAALQSHPTARVVVEGYADSTGPDTTNRPLSQARADAVKQYLVAHGAPANRIEAVGHGAERPIDPGTSQNALATNRRVELVVTAR